MTRTSGRGTRQWAAVAALGCAAVALTGCTTASASGQAPVVAADVAKFPADASVITFREDLGLKPGQEEPQKPVTVTGRATVRKIVALINAQPRVPSSPFGCPADYGQSITLTFRAKAGGPVLAAATLVTSGCEIVSLTVGGKQQPSHGPGAGRTVAAGSLKIAGVAWKLPPELP